jgi:hypothetical protein
MAPVRRFDAGPLLVAVGAVVLLVSLFVDWYDGAGTAWEVFEIVDLLLAGLALAALVAAVGILAPPSALLEADRMPLVVAGALALVALQLLSPPPAAAGASLVTGIWLALGGAALMALGTLLSFGRVGLAISYQGREVRRRVAAVDARAGAEDAGAAPGRAEEAPLFDVGVARADAPASGAAGTAPEPPPEPPART